MMKRSRCTHTPYDTVTIGPMTPYEITCDPARFDVGAIHDFLAQSYWSPGIPRDIVERALANSLCFVFILPERRGMGLAKRLIEDVLRHPDLQGLRRFLLATRDAHTSYAKFGFKPLARPDRIMEIQNPDAYANKASTESPAR
jgi:GNAT superfamily N-acetyltransferase